MNMTTSRKPHPRSSITASRTTPRPSAKAPMRTNCPVERPARRAMTTPLTVITRQNTVRTRHRTNTPIPSPTSQHGPNPQSSYHGAREAPTAPGTVRAVRPSCLSFVVPRGTLARSDLRGPPERHQGGGERGEEGERRERSERGEMGEDVSRLRYKRKPPGHGAPGRAGPQPLPAPCPPRPEVEGATEQGIVGRPGHVTTPSRDVAPSWSGTWRRASRCGR